MIPVLFISYSRKNEQLKDQLVQQLMVLEPEGLIEIWIDDRIPAGAEWLEVINEALLQADIAILLITSDFLTSKFILEKEVPTLLKRRWAGGLSLFPIIGLSCAWQEVSWLAKLNVRPKNGVPVWGKGRRVAERYLAEIAREIAENVRKTDSTKPPIRSAIESLELRFQEAFSSPKSIDREHIVNTIGEAISYGSPIYNSGDIEGCVEIYHHTARRLLTQLRKAGPELDGSGMVMMGKDSAGMPTRREMLDKAMMMGGSGNGETSELETSVLLSAIRHDLRRTLEIIEQLRGHDPDRAAWDLRFCFNRILLLLQGFEKTASLTASSTGYSKAKIRSNFRMAIYQASRSGRMIYAASAPKSLPDERSIVTCSAFLLAESRLLLKLMVGELQLPFGSLAEEFFYSMLDRIVTEHQEVTQSNAFLIAWTALQTYDWYLMPSD
jgi:hypothetical protein